MKGALSKSKKSKPRAPTTKKSKSSKTQMQLAAQVQEDTISRMQQVQAEMQALEGSGGQLDDSYLFGGGPTAPVAAAPAVPAAAPAAPSAMSMLGEGMGGHASDPSSSSGAHAACIHRRRQILRVC